MSSDNNQPSNPTSEQTRRPSKDTNVPSFLAVVMATQKIRRLARKRLRERQQSKYNAVLEEIGSGRGKKALRHLNNSVLSETASSGTTPQQISLEVDRLLDVPSSNNERPTLGGETRYRESVPMVLWEMISGKSVVSWCLLAAPVALWAGLAHWSPTSVFWLNFVVLIPLAAILGDFTEECALHTNQTIGGLINATFGNAVEVVIAIQALLAREIRVVQASMLGSILSNLLLVLGSCLFFGGLRYSEQQFNSKAATANMGLLALSSMALALPTPFANYYKVEDEHVLMISRIAAVFLLFMYLQLLFFQLYTHTHIFDESSSTKSNPPTSAVAQNSDLGTGGRVLQTRYSTVADSDILDSNDGEENGEENGEEEEEEAQMPFGVSIVGLLVTTLLVTLFSDFLVSSIDGFTQASGVSRTFVGIVLLPIVGNAVEHVSAVSVAMKGKMDLAMGISIGSCTQISLFVVPLTVLVGWVFDRDMTLNFPHFEVTLFVLSVFTVSIVTSNPTTNWLEGSLLITTYILVAVGFWFEDVRDF
jgi:Ca2+:H+ antiporter